MRGYLGVAKRTSPWVLVFVLGLSLGFALRGRAKPATKSVPPADRFHTDRFLVTQPDPCDPLGRRTRLLTVRDGPAVSADRQPPHVWLVTLIRDDPDCGQPWVTYTAEER